MTITGWAFHVLRSGLVAGLASSSVLASTVAVFGPLDVVRDRGKPRPVVFTFSSADPSAPHVLRIHNGGENGEMPKVSSAVIRLNGVQILGPNRFNSQVSVIEQAIRPERENTLVVEVRSKPGAGFSIQVTSVDDDPPVVSQVFPDDGKVVSRPEVTLSMRVEDLLSGVKLVTCDGVAATAQVVGYACTVPLLEGPNAIEILATDGCDNSSLTTHTIVYDPPPVVSISTPADGSLHFSSPVTVTGTVDDPTAKVTVNGVVATGTAPFTASVPLPSGESTITARAVDLFGGVGTDSVEVTVLFPGLGPTVAISSPRDGFVIGGPRTGAFPPATVAVTGRMRVVGPFNQGNTPDVSVDGQDARVFKGGFPGLLCTPLAICWWDFEATGMTLPEGAVTITATGTDKAGQSVSATSSGIVDVCVDGGFDGAARVGSGQSNRCHFIDGCSTPDWLVADPQDPTQGFLGHRSTAFGKDTDVPPTPERFPHGALPLDSLPCNLHDVCYQTCGSNREACDDDMYDAMVEVCFEAYPEAICPHTIPGPFGTRILNPVLCPLWRDEKTRCYQDAREYRVGLRVFGGPRFNDRQSEFCLP